MSTTTTKKFIDLHLHSLYSEGALTPQQIVERAQKNNVAVIAIADHNTIAGSKILLKINSPKLKTLSAVELYTKYKTQSFHLLGYNFHLHHDELNSIIANLEKKHLGAAQKCIKKLNKLGFIIDWEKVSQTQSHYIGHGHIVHALEKNPKNLEKLRKFIQPDGRLSFFAVVNAFLIKNRLAHLEENNLPIDQAIKLIKKAGGIPVLAHPGQQLSWERDYYIKILKAMGLQGLEVISPYHNWGQIEHYQKMALNLNLAITGGSDFHCDVNFTGRELIKNQWDYFKIPYRLFTEFEKQFLK